MWIYEKLNDVPKNDTYLIAISGFPGMGLVGKTVADYMKKYLDAKAVARIYGYGFPAQLLSYENGYADVLHVEISYAKKNGLGIFIITGDLQPISNRNQHSLSKYLVRKLNEFGVKELIAAAAYVSEITSHNRHVYVVGNNLNIIQKYAAKGAIPLSGGVVSGLNGIIVGWAKLYRIDAVCLLGETWRSIAEMNYIDYTAAKIVIDLLNSVWGLNINTNELEQKGLSVENQVRNILDQYLHAKPESLQEKRPYYIT